MSRTIAFVQARMSSTRLPGKVVAPIGSRPLLGLLLDRLSASRTLDGVVVTTSRLPEDDAVATLCNREGTSCWRGDLDDVAGRLVEAVAAHGADIVVRISGDSPLIDPAVVDDVVMAFVDARQGPCDLATNVFPRSYPVGQSVEVLSASTLAAAVAEMRSHAHREHVTPWFYEQADRLAIRNVVLDPPAPDVRLAVDVAADLERVERLVLAMDGPLAAYGVRELIELADALGVVT